MSFSFVGYITLCGIICGVIASAWAVLAAPIFYESRYAYLIEVASALLAIFMTLLALFIIFGVAST